MAVRYLFLDLITRRKREKILSTKLDENAKSRSCVNAMMIMMAKTKYLDSKRKGALFWGML